MEEREAGKSDGEERAGQEADVKEPKQEKAVEVVAGVPAGQEAAKPAVEVEAAAADVQVPDPAVDQQDRQHQQQPAAAVEPAGLADEGRKRSADHSLSDTDEEEDDAWRVLREEAVHNKASPPKKTKKKPAPRKKKGGVTLPKNLVTSIEKNLNRLRQAIDQQDGKV